MVNDHARREPADALVSEIRGAGGSAAAVGADVSREDEVRALVDQAVPASGRVDTLVATPGAQKDAAIGDTSLDDWRAAIDVDLAGQFLCCREAVRQSRRQPQDARPFRSAGAIVLMSSVHDGTPWAAHANHAASKAGVSMLTRTLAQEVGADKVRINAVAPGATRTPINASVWEDPDALARLLSLAPYGRIGEPEDVASAVAWLVSDEADSVTGTTLYIAGGMTLYPEFRDNG